MTQREEYPDSQVLWGELVDVNVQKLISENRDDPTKSPWRTLMLKTKEVSDVDPDYVYRFLVMNDLHMKWTTKEIDQCRLLKYPWLYWVGTCARLALWRQTFNGSDFIVVRAGTELAQQVHPYTYTQSEMDKIIAVHANTDIAKFANEIRSNHYFKYQLCVACTPIALCCHQEWFSEKVPTTEDFGTLHVKKDAYVYYVVFKCVYYTFFIAQYATYRDFIKELAEAFKVTPVQGQEINEITIIKHLITQK